MAFTLPMQNATSARDAVWEAATAGAKDARAGRPSDRAPRQAGESHESKRVAWLAGFAAKRLTKWLPRRNAAPRRRAADSGRRSLMRSRSGAAALEFALVAPPFLVLVFGVMEIGFDLFVQGALNAAVQQAARTVQTGAVQGTSGESSAQFAAAAVCPALGGRLSCAQIVAGVKPVPSGYNYYSNPAPLTLAGAAGGAVCTGTGGQMMLIEAWYLGPTFAGLLIPTFSTRYNGALVHITSASAGFVNEYFTGGQTTGTGC